MSPRKPSSGWSRSNKERVERLEREGLMTDAGRAAIEAAKRNGSWSLLDSVEALEEPGRPRGRAEREPGGAGELRRLSRPRRGSDPHLDRDAKREETRRKRIEETTRLAAENVRANQ